MTDRYSGPLPWFDNVDVYPSASQLPVGGDSGVGFCVVLSPPSLYIYTPSGGYQLVAASTPTTPATPASEGGQGVVELATEAEVISGAAGVLVATVARLKAELDRRGTGVAASETAAGTAEIATQAETDAGTDNQRIVTPLKLASRTATETRAGVVELATSAETTTGTDTSRAIHPAGFKAAITPEAWIAPTLLASWVNFGSPYALAGYRKTPWGEVQLRGLIKNGTTTAGTVVLNLPGGYRPANDRERAFVSVQGGNNACRINVLANGDVAIAGVSDNSFLSLESVRFDV